MKKLMMAAAIVCVAALSQAATCNWTLSAGGTSLTAPTGVTFKDGWNSATMYVFMDEWTSSQASAARKQMLADLKTSQTVSGATTTKALSNGTFADTVFKVADQTAGNSYRAYAVIIAEATDGAKYAYFSNTMSESAIEDGKGTASISATMNSTSLKGISTTAATSTGWYQLTSSSSTPEPTSGLLLLLGMGALALRRRRA